MSIDIKIEFNGVWRVGFVIDNGKGRTREYLEKLKKDKKLDRLAAIVAHLAHFSQHGPSRNREKFASEGDGIFALKSFQEHIYGFYVGKNFFVCAAGTTKKRNRADQDLLNLVRGIKRRYEEQERTQERKLPKKGGGNG